MLGRLHKADAGLYGLDNFYYRRSVSKEGKSDGSLYGLDNFYYRR